MLKTHTCGELRENDAGTPVILAGWVNRRRDQGGLIFIDLRDRWGVTQVVVDLESVPTAHAIADSVRNEYVLQVSGNVRIRPEGTANPDLDTGDIDIVADDITILNRSRTPPFYINKDEGPVDEALRTSSSPGPPSLSCNTSTSRARSANERLRSSCTFAVIRLPLGKSSSPRRRSSTTQ